MNTSRLENKKSETLVKIHLESALEEDDPAAKNLHIRSALQYLTIQETGRH
jgi:hypothetical protein